MYRINKKKYLAPVFERFQLQPKRQQTKKQKIDICYAILKYVNLC